MMNITEIFKRMTLGFVLATVPMLGGCSNNTITWQEEVKLLEEMANDLAYGIETLRTRVSHEAAEKQLEFLAHHDVLTGLPNRLLLRDRFDQASAQADREQSGVAVLFLDL